MKIVAIADVHGELKKLKKLVKECDINFETDTLVFLGDYIDRGKDAAGVVAYVRDLQKKHPDNVVCLMGNHEDMAINEISWWAFNGKSATVKSYYKKYGNSARYRLNSDIAWFRRLPLYYETEDFVFVHAGIDPSKPLKDQDPQYLLWAREDYLYDPRRFDKMVISGHTPSLSMFTEENDKPYRTIANNLVIDTGACFGGALTAAIFEDNGKVNFISIKD